MINLFIDTGLTKIQITSDVFYFTSCFSYKKKIVKHNKSKGKTNRKRRIKIYSFTKEALKKKRGEITSLYSFKI